MRSRLSLRRGADRDDRAERRVARGGVDRLEAAHARSPQGHPRRVRAHQLRHRQHVVDSAGPERALGAAVPAGVEGQRGHPLRAAAAGEVEVALLRRAGAVQHHHPGGGLALGQEQRVGEPVEASRARAGPEGRAS